MKYKLLAWVCLMMSMFCVPLSFTQTSLFLQIVQLFIGLLLFVGSGIIWKKGINSEDCS